MSNICPGDRTADQFSLGATTMSCTTLFAMICLLVCWPGRRCNQLATFGSHRLRPIYMRNREDRWDEAAGLSLDVVAYAAPQEHTAVNAAERRGQPWTILASMCTRGKVRSTSSPRGVRSSSGASAP